MSGPQANIVNELHTGYELFEYTATRNWSDADMHAAADALRERGVLDGDRPSCDDLDHVVRQANQWSQLIIERG